MDFTPTTTQNHSVSLQMSTLRDAIQLYINRMQNHVILTKNATHYTPHTIKTYKQAQVFFDSFQKENELNLSLYEVTKATLSDFHIYLSKQHLSLNTIALMLSKIKAVLSYANSNGINCYSGKGFVPVRERSVQSYLTKEDLKKIKEVKLSPSKQRVIDFLFLQSFTGLRNGTLRKFLKSPLTYINNSEGKYYIEITEDKTNKSVIIPLGTTAMSIIEKYKEGFEIPTRQYLDRVIKEVGKEAGLTDNIVVRKIIQGEMKEYFVPKYKTLSTHTARRTLITLMAEAQFSNKDIMVLSGHSTEQQLNNYIKLNDLQKAKHLFGNEFFNQEI